MYTITITHVAPPPHFSLSLSLSLNPRTGLTQPVEHETTYFRDPGAPMVVQSLASPGGAGAAVPAPQKPKARSKPRGKGKVSTTGDLGESGNLSDKERMETLILTIEALRAQMEDQVRVKS